MSVAEAIDFRPDAPDFLRDPFPVLRLWWEIALAVPEPRLEWLNSMVFRGMTSMPVSVKR